MSTCAPACGSKSLSNVHLNNQHHRPTAGGISAHFRISRAKNELLDILIGLCTLCMSDDVVSPAHVIAAALFPEASLNVAVAMRRNALAALSEIFTASLVTVVRMFANNKMQ